MCDRRVRFCAYNAAAVTLPHDLDQHDILDELRRQLQRVAEHGVRHGHIELSDAYTARLDSHWLRGHIVTLALANDGLPAWGGIDVRSVPSRGIARVVV
jgi:hypothetical protein